MGSPDIPDIGQGFKQDAFGAGQIGSYAMGSDGLNRFVTGVVLFRPVGVRLVPLKHMSWIHQKTREGCGCPKFPAGKVFRQISTLLESDSPIFRQREMLSLPRFGHFPARKTAAGKLAAPAGTLLDFLLQDRHCVLEFF